MIEQAFKCCDEEAFGFKSCFVILGNIDAALSRGELCATQNVAISQTKSFLPPLIMLNTKMTCRCFTVSCFIVLRRPELVGESTQLKTTF